jgi:ATP-binding cassette, subfamily B, bacterial
VTALMDRFTGLIDAFQPAKGPPPNTLYAFLRWALFGAEKGIAITLIVQVATGFAEMSGAWFTGRVLDAAVGDPAMFWATYWPLILVGGLIFLLIRPLLFAADAGVTSILLGPHLFPLILSRLNRHTLGQSMRFFENDFAGRISQKAMQTARAVTDVVIECSDVVVYGLSMFVASLLLMAGVNTSLLLVFVIWGVLYAMALWWFIPRVQAKSADRAGARTLVTGQIVDTLSNIATVKLFAHDENEDRAALEAMERFRVKALDFGKVSANFRFVLTLLGGILPLLSIIGSLWLWSRGQATPGDIAMAAMVSTRLSQITNRLGRAAVSISANIGEISDGVATLARTHEVTDRANALANVAGPGAIRFEGVEFGYGTDVPALNGMTLDIVAGEKIALVGASGAGKSTFVALLLRLYDVEGGRILLDGVDLRDIQQIALRRQIAVVRQDAAMFNRSARDNIRYGRSDATDSEVEEAARRASAHEFILNLEDHRGRRGYDARLGERGVKLSGGQCQRIALARAILKDAPVLVLDEATSALDSEVEADIQTALNGVMQGKTVIAIAHRLSTIAAMDRIVVLEGGQIAEQGRHNELLANNGLYARFWARQSGGFIGLEDAAE